MKTVAIVGFVWLIGQFVGLLVWSLVMTWKTPSHTPKCEIFGKEVS